MSVFRTPRLPNISQDNLRYNVSLSSNVTHSRDGKEADHPMLSPIVTWFLVTSVVGVVALLVLAIYCILQRKYGLGRVQPKSASMWTTGSSGQTARMSTSSSFSDLNQQNRKISALPAFARSTRFASSNDRQ